MNSWVDCWLVVSGSDDGIRTHARRPHKIRTHAFATRPHWEKLNNYKFFFSYQLGKTFQNLHIGDVEAK